VVTKALDRPSGIRPPEFTYHGLLGFCSYRCPVCGHLEALDSAIPGTCVLCPGLVGIEPL
jgi:hypothetical protein